MTLKFQEEFDILNSDIDKNANIVTVCNYGQVRSVCMAKRLREMGYTRASAMGMFGLDPHVTSQILYAADLIIICNKPNYLRLVVEKRPDNDSFGGYDITHLNLWLSETEYKTVGCDTIGFDRWGNSDHPDLVNIVKKFLCFTDTNT